MYGEISQSINQKLITSKCEKDEEDDTSSSSDSESDDELPVLKKAKVRRNVVVSKKS